MISQWINTDVGMFPLVPEANYLADYNLCEKTDLCIKISIAYHLVTIKYY